MTTTGSTAEPATSAHRALVSATIESIHRYGLHDTSVGSVTELAGLSRGMVRHCYESKSAMLVAAYETLRDEWMRMLTDQPEASGLARLERIVAMSFAPPAFDPPKISAWLAFSVAAQRDPALREVNRTTYAWLRDHIEQAAAAHVAETGGRLDPGRVAATLLALTDGLWLQHLLDSEAMPASRAREICRAALLASVT